MNILKILSLLILSARYSRAAISILIQPGQNAGTTLFTVTQISPSPVLGVADLSGYVSGMSIPTAMFNIAGMDSGYSTHIWGDSHQFPCDHHRVLLRLGFLAQPTSHLS